MHSFYCPDFLNNLPLFKNYEDNMKRIILVGLIGFALSGCGDSEDTNNTDNSDKYQKDIANKNEHVYLKIKSEGYCTRIE